MTLLQEFEAGTLDPAGFSHADHIRAAHALLAQAEFFEASARYAAALRRLTAKAGAPEKYSATVTFAFLALIAERMREGEDAEAFVSAHPDLLSAALSAHYSSARLADPAGRRAPLLPDRAPPSGAAQHAGLDVAANPA